MFTTKNNLITPEVHHNSAAEALPVHIRSKTKSPPLIVGSLFRFPSYMSEEQMTEILQIMDWVKSSNFIWIGGDRNLPDSDWKYQQTSGKSDPLKINEAFLDKITDHGLHQINDKPRKGEAILDLILTTRPNLITRTTAIPRLNDPDTILSLLTAGCMQCRPNQSQ